jgi:hypothetical protein
LGWYHAADDDEDVFAFVAPARCLESRPHVLTALRACGDPKAVLSPLRSVARGWATQYRVASGWQRETNRGS